MKATIFAIAKGPVQGVGFRYSATQLAKRHNLLGYAKNLPDGTVELLIHGETSSIDHFFKELKTLFQLQDDQITTVDKELPNPLPNDFQIKH